MEDTAKESIAQAIAEIPEKERREFNSAIREIDFNLSSDEKFGEAVAQEVFTFIGTQWGIAIITSKKLIWKQTASSIKIYLPCDYAMKANAIENRKNRFDCREFGHGLLGSLEVRRRFLKFCHQTFDD